MTEFEPHSRIVYTVTIGAPAQPSPRHDHFRPDRFRNPMEWNIEIGTRLPGLDFVIARCWSGTSAADSTG